MTSKEKPSFSPDNFKLTAEGGKNFFIYLKRFDLFREQDMLILSPNIHFYYDENELKNVRTFIILRKLNLIKELDIFLQTVSRILPPNVNFIGCFNDRKTIGEDGYLTELSTRFNSLLDSKTYNSLDRREVKDLLEKYGFRIIDISVLEGLSFFYSQNNRKHIEIGDPPNNS
jgi:hypothetical protein